MTQIPIKFQEHLQLSNIDRIELNSLSIESGRFLCVREQIDDTTYQLIIDTENPSTQSRKLSSVDSAKLNHAGKVIALKGKVAAEGTAPAVHSIQLYDVEKDVVKKVHLCTEDIEYFKWIDNNTLGIVTAKTVYHWIMEGFVTPVKMFDRHASLDQCQIINYRTDAKQNWLLLIGITAQQNPVVGKIQLYSVRSKFSDTIQGHAAAFAHYKFPENQMLSSILCFADRNSLSGKLHIKELEALMPPNLPIPKKTANMNFAEVEDYALGLEIDNHRGIIFLMTRMGFIFMLDIESATCIYTNSITRDTIFVTAPHEASGGIIAVNLRGQVLSVSVEEDNIIHYISTQLNPEIARRIKKRFSKNSLEAKDSKVTGINAPTRTPFEELGRFVRTTNASMNSRSREIEKLPNNREIEKLPNNREIEKLPNKLLEPYFPGLNQHARKCIFCELKIYKKPNGGSYDFNGHIKICKLFPEDVIQELNNRIPGV